MPAAAIGWHRRRDQANDRLHTPGVQSLLVFLIFLAAYRDRDYVGAATGSKLTIGTGDQDDTVALALASNVTATDLDVGEIAVARHRCQPIVRSHTLNIHGCITSLQSIGTASPPFSR